VEEDQPPSGGAPPPPNQLTSTADNGSSIVLSQDNAEATFTTFTWTATDFGGKAVKYSVELDVAGNDFSRARDIVTTGELGTELSVEEINAALINYGIDPGESASVQMRVRSWVDYLTTPSLSSSSGLSTGFLVLRLRGRLLKVWLNIFPALHSCRECTKVTQTCAVRNVLILSNELSVHVWSWNGHLLLSAFDK
jgi:hypothetical protein